MQKKVLALHDLSCFGRSSLVPIISIISAGGHQCVPLPTAVFSTHLGIDNWVTTDLSDAMDGAIAQYQSLGLQFEAVYAGFLSTERQIDLVAKAATALRVQDAICLIDPVMGDNGIVYETYTEDMCFRMRELCEIADIITPNVTEAAILLDEAPTTAPRSEAEAIVWMRRLQERYHVNVVLTGLSYEPGKIGSGCVEGAKEAVHLHDHIGTYYPGTGDVFASVLLSYLLNGATLQMAVVLASHFVRDAIAYTAHQGTNPMHGVQYEKLLSQMITELDD